METAPPPSPQVETPVAPPSPETPVPTPEPLPTPKSPLKPILLILVGLVTLSLLATLAIRYFNLDLASLTIPSTPISTMAPSTTPTSILEPESTVTPAPDPTAGWKTYIHPSYNFSFKYPPEAEILVEGLPPEETRLIFVGPQQKASGRTQTELFDGYMFIVKARGNLTSDTVDSITQTTYEGARQNCYEQSTFTPISSSQVNQIPAKTYQVTNCLGDYTEHFFSYHQDILEITQLYTGTPADTQNYRQTTSQILSTFRFLE